MEQVYHLDNTMEYLCGICTLKFRGDSLIKHITEHITMPDKHAHSLWCNLCSPLLRNSDECDMNEMEYSNEMDMVNMDRINRTPVDGNNPYLLPDQYVASHTRLDGYESVPVADVLNYYNVNSYEWHKDDFHDESNLYPPQNSFYTANYVLAILGGTTYFFPHMESRIALNADYAENVRSKVEVRNTGIEYTNVSCAEPRLEAETALNVDFIENVRSKVEVANTDIQHTNISCIEPRLEGETAEIPNVDVSIIETVPGTTKSETMLGIKDISVTIDALKEMRISQSSNVEFQPNTSNSEKGRIDASTNHEGLLNSTNLNCVQSSSNRNVFKHEDSEDTSKICHNVEENNIQKHVNISGNTSSRRNRRADSRKVHGNSYSRRGRSGINFGDYVSRQDGQSSSDLQDFKRSHYQNGSNNRLGNTNSRRGSRSSKENLPPRFRPTLNRNCNVDNEYVKSQENSKNSGTPSEVSKSSYSAAVKSSLNMR